MDDYSHLFWSARSGLHVPSRAVSLFVLDPVTCGMKYVIHKHKFLPSIASAVFVYWKKVRFFEESSDTLFCTEKYLDGASKLIVEYFKETHLDGQSKMIVKDFRDLVTSYQHMKTLLEVHALPNLDVSVFYARSSVVDQAIGSSEYRQMVEFLVNCPRFWRDGERFVKVVEPLLKLLVVLTLSGTTIGHQRRCFETTTELYADFSSTWERILKDEKGLWEVSTCSLSVAAAVLDPGYLFLPGFDEFEASQRLSEFEEEFVMESDKINFQKDVSLYLGKSPILFNAAAMTAKDGDHPVYFWHYLGHPLPTLRRYAKKLVFLDNITSNEELEALFLNEKELDKEEMNSAALRGYEQCDAERLACFISQIGVSGPGYLEFWSKLRNVDEEGWRSISVECPSYARFCRTVEPFL